MLIWIGRQYLIFLLFFLLIFNDGNKNTPKSEASRKIIWSSLSWMFLKLDLGFVPGLAFQNWVSRNILLTTVLSKGMSTEGLVVIVVINVHKGTL